MSRSQQLRSIIIKWRALIAYLLLAAAIAYSIGYVRHEGNSRRNAITDSGRAVITASCERDNKTRETLRELMATNIPQIKKLEKEGTLNHVQAQRSIDETYKAIKKLPNTDCKAAGAKFAKGAHAQDN